MGGKYINFHLTQVVVSANEFRNLYCTLTEKYQILLRKNITKKYPFFFSDEAYSDINAKAVKTAAELGLDDMRLVTC